MPTNRIRCAVAVGLVVMVGLAASSGAASAPVAGSRQAADAAQASWTIAFDGGASTSARRRGRRPTDGIYVMNADGSGKRLLMRNASLAAWSPDGRKIAFGRWRGDNDDIFVMNADGSGQRNLTRTQDAIDQGALWSPDGRKIAFMSSRGDDTGIYVMNADGSGQRRLTHNDAGLGVWSPDGRKIAFGSGYYTNIYVMNPDGSGKRLLTRNGGGPVWSPDARKIAFTGTSTSKRDGSELAWDVWVMNADGSGRRNLTRRPVIYGCNDSGASPAWSPDGRKIAFDRGRGIFVMNADGSGQRRLTKFGRQAAWSPDGRMIAFRSWGADNVEIFVMNADGSGIRNLTRTPNADEMNFAWAPEGPYLARARAICSSASTKHSATGGILDTPKSYRAAARLSEDALEKLDALPLPLDADRALRSRWFSLADQLPGVLRRTATALDAGNIALFYRLNDKRIDLIHRKDRVGYLPRQCPLELPA